MPSDSKPTGWKNNPWLSVDNAGRYRVRWRRWFLGVGGMLVAQAACWLWLTSQNDTWIGPPLIVSVGVSIALLLFVQAKRFARVANNPKGRYRLPLLDALLLFTAVAILFGGYRLNTQQRAAELARRDKIASTAEAVLGPGGKIERDHRARLWITIADPTFDDERLVRLAALIGSDVQRYGVDRLTLDPAAIRQLEQPTWAGLTDRSIDVLLEWRSLRECYLRGAAMSESGLARLADLPSLRWLDTGGFGEEAAQAIKAKRPDLWIGATSDFP